MFYWKVLLAIAALAALAAVGGDIDWLNYNWF